MFMHRTMITDKEIEIMSRKTNKTITAVGMAVLMTAAGVLTAMAAQSPTITAGNGMSQIEAVRPGGTESGRQNRSRHRSGEAIISADNGSIDMDCPSGNIYEGEVIVNISGDTLILDGENGYPIEAKDLQAGETVYAYIGPAMTMSLPPQTSGEVIIGKIPADMKGTGMHHRKIYDGKRGWKLDSCVHSRHRVRGFCGLQHHAVSDQTDRFPGGRGAGQQSAGME